MIDAATSSSLAMLAAAMAPARDPWWIIGSAAVVLHGAATTVADIDVLLSVRDADEIDMRLSLAPGGGDENGMFRSSRYGRWREPPLPVEFMAGLSVRGALALQPRSRVARSVGRSTVYVPDLDEVIAILDLFGRPKDMARAALLRARPS